MSQSGTDRVTHARADLAYTLFELEHRLRAWAPRSNQPGFQYLLSAAHKLGDPRQLFNLLASQFPSLESGDEHFCLGGGGAKAII